MKKFAGLIVPLLLVGAVVQVISCKKPFDKMLQQAPRDFKFCNIKKMTTVSYDFSGFKERELHWMFTYNSHGDPVSVERDLPGTGRPNFLFRYDDQHRLTDWIGVYGTADNPDAYEYWERYTYNSKNKIIKADVFMLGDYGNDPYPGARGRYEVFYQYDVYGRLVKATHKSATSSSDRFYTYDANGNRLVTAGYPVVSDYDDFINLHWTNRIWQFVDREYSINNPVQALKYNRVGLPLQFDSAIPLQFLGVSFHAAVIEYDCDPGVKM